MYTIATPARRLGGHLIDLVTGMIVIVILGTFISRQPGANIVIGAFVYCIGMAWFWSQGSSPGKLVFSMRVIRKDTKETIGFWTMLLRESIGKFLSSLVFSAGYLWILFDKDNQGWHDKLVNTIVVTND